MKVVAIRLLTTVAIVGVWEWVGRAGYVPAGVVPPFTSVLSQVVVLLGDPGLGRDALQTVRLVAGGFAIGTAFGGVLGAITGSSKYLTQVVEPLVYSFSGVPKIIILPILLLLLGVGGGAIVAMAALSAVFPVFVGCASAVRDVGVIYVKTARTLGASRWRVFVNVYVPGAAGGVLAAVRLGLGVAIVGSLLAESAAGQGGIGYRVIQYYQELAISDMYALLLLVFAVAIGLNWMFGRLIYWSTRHAGARSDVAAAA